MVTVQISSSNFSNHSSIKMYFIRMMDVLCTCNLFVVIFVFLLLHVKLFKIMLELCAILRVISLEVIILLNVVHIIFKMFRSTLVKNVILKSTDKQGWAISLPFIYIFFKCLHNT